MLSATHRRGCLDRVARPTRKGSSRADGRRSPVIRPSDEWLSPRAGAASATPWGRAWRRTPLPLQPPERSLRTASVPASAIGSRWRVSRLLARASRGRPSTAPIPPRTATSSAESPERNSRIARCAVRLEIPARSRYGNHSPRSTSPWASASSAPILMKAAMDSRRVRVCSRQCRRVRSARPVRRSSGTGIDAVPRRRRGW